MHFIELLTQQYIHTSQKSLSTSTQIELALAPLSPFPRPSIHPNIFPSCYNPAQPIAAQPIPVLHIIPLSLLCSPQIIYTSALRCTTLELYPTLRALRALPSLPSLLYFTLNPPPLQQYPKPDSQQKNPETSRRSYERLRSY